MRVERAAHGGCVPYAALAGRRSRSARSRRGPHSVGLDLKADAGRAIVRTASRTRRRPSSRASVRASRQRLGIDYTRLVQAITQRSSTRRSRDMGQRDPRASASGTTSTTWPRPGSSASRVQRVFPATPSPMARPARRRPQRRRRAPRRRAKRARPAPRSRDRRRPALPHGDGARSVLAHRRFAPAGDTHLTGRYPWYAVHDDARRRRGGGRRRRAGLPYARSAAPSGIRSWPSGNMPRAASSAARGRVSARPLPTRPETKPWRSSTTSTPVRARCSRRARSRTRR